MKCKKVYFMNSWNFHSNVIVGELNKQQMQQASER